MLPKDVAQNPVQATDRRPLLAELVVQYPGDEANDVHIDYYFYDPLHEIETFTGGTRTTWNDGSDCVAYSIDADGCVIRIQVPNVTTGGFKEEEVPGGSAITYRWLDLASFYWFDPPGEVVLEPDVPDEPVDEDPICPPTPPPETTGQPYCEVAAAPSVCPPKLPSVTTGQPYCEASTQLSGSDVEISEPTVG